MLKTLTFIRHNAIALAALLVALGGVSYAAIAIPRNSVGTRQLRSRAVTATKLDPKSIAASIGAWANLTWSGVWHVQASNLDISVSSTALGELVSWKHTRFARNCMASVTPQRNFGPGGAGGTGTVDGYVSTRFDPPKAQLQIDGIAADGTRQNQSVTVLIVCPTAGSQKVNR